jgi:SAM-dependent methyltransferase
MLIHADRFYVKVLKKAISEGLLQSDYSVLVVCGGSKDDACLREAGISNYVISNISDGVEVDVENLPYAKETFDAVIVHSGLHHCASPHRGLLEMLRVARRCVVLLEPADNLATRLGKKLGVGQTYEFVAVADNGLRHGGWRNTSIPNWVYRFTASEIRQTVSCAAPFGPHRFLFFYRTRVPWRQLKMRRNKFPLFLILCLTPLLRILDAIGPVFSNNMAAVIKKPLLPTEMFPWLEIQDGDFVGRRSWFHHKYPNHSE